MILNLQTVARQVQWNTVFVIQLIGALRKTCSSNTTEIPFTLSQFLIALSLNIFTIMLHLVKQNIRRCHSKSAIYQIALKCFSSDASHSLKRTVLYDFHVKHGGKMVPFASYEMPVLYNGDLSIRDSHLHTREKASLFDVSHMLQLNITGSDRVKFFESLVVADVSGLSTNGATLTLFTTEKGGIIDDLIVTKKSDNLYVVSNAGRATEDLQHLKESKEKFLKQHPNADLSMSILADFSLLALQGPQSEAVLQKDVNVDLRSLKFMNGIDATFEGVPIRITRCGYTGEDGFELSIPNAEAVNVAERLLQSESVKLAGLGARDSLRLEAGLCLYGNDIDESTTPIEAGLAWTIAKRRRTAADFPGAQIILKQLKEKPLRRRVGLLAVSSGPPVRAHAKVYSGASSDASAVGEVSSGCPAPSVARNIAMAYVPASLAKVGTKLFCDVRGKLYEYEVAKMPFHPTHYYL